MKIRSGIKPATISAITMMLQPHIPEISPQNLIAALRNYGNSTESKKCSAQRPLTRAEAAKLLSTAHHLAVYEKRQAASAAQSLSNASPQGRVTQGNPPKYTLRGAKIKAADFWAVVRCTGCVLPRK